MDNNKPNFNQYLNKVCEYISDEDDEEDFDFYIHITPTYMTQQFKEPRNGKMLLVLDIDQTIYYETRGSNYKYKICTARPFLIEFLNNVNEFYDIVIWSATEKKHIIRKMEKMNLHLNDRYNIMFYLDINIMERVPKHGSSHFIFFKPLQSIWKVFPQYYDHRNSILIDDCSENFFGAQKNGILIEKYNGNYKDQELRGLGKYLVNLAKTSTDFTEVDHSQWKNIVSTNSEDS